MTKEVVAFDLETTGLDVKKDYIIQMALIKFNSDTFEELKRMCFYIIPDGDFIITDEAFNKHGISLDKINSKGKRLTEIWDVCKEFIGNCDMLSYNGNHFDVPMLYNNLLRCGLTFDFQNRTFYDSLVIERKRNSMRLEDVYKRYTGETLDNAHDAFFDTQALIKIFKHQCENTNESVFDRNFNLPSIEDFLKYNEDGDLTFTIGKYRNKKTNDICISDPRYIKWIFESDFSELTKKSIQNEWYKVHTKNSTN
jgi:DNA polymerase-3 subunit epsilon